MKTKHLPILIAGAVGLQVACTSLCAQSSAIEQMDDARRRGETRRLLDAASGEDAPQLYEDEMKDVGPQSVLKLKQRKRYFEASADSQFFYTSNVLLEEGAEGIDSTLWVNTAHVALAPPPYTVGPGQLAPRLGYKHQWFNFSLENQDHRDSLGTPLNDFDFDAQTVFAEGRYDINGRWMVLGAFEWTRLLSHMPEYTSYQEFYKEYALRWGLIRQFAFCETKVLSVGYQGNYRWTDTPLNPFEGINDRTEHALFAGYTQALTPKLIVQPFYRLSWSHYTDSAADGRDDLLHNFGASLNYCFTQNIAARMFAGYAVKHSDAGLIPEYRKMDLGLGFNLNFTF